MKDLRVTPIKNGTVIDHIEAGYSFKVLRIIGILDEKVTSPVSVLMHVQSKKHGWKDIVKVEDREIQPSELDKISLISPGVTINIIRNYQVAEKYKPKPPESIVGIVKCPNPNCITNKEREPIKSKFTLISENPVKIRCYYCGHVPENVDEVIV